MVQVASMPATIKTSEWITPEEVPDPKPLPRVAGWNILLRPVSIVQRTKGGIIVPETVQDNIERITTVARVLAIGPLAYKHPDFMGEPFCKVGDIVAYGKFSGQKLKYKGVALILADERAVTMVIDDPKDLDMHFNLASY